MLKILLEILASADQIMTSEIQEQKIQLMKINEDLSQINAMLNKSLNRDKAKH